MLNKLFPLLLAVVAALLLSFSAGAQVPAPGFPAPPPAAAEGPLTVTDVIIDRTDKNAVAAKEYAIAQAKHVAFEKLAEKFMSPDLFKAYLIPDDQTVSAYVDDFEIKNEQISANRYIANFTVRFNADAATAIKSAGGTVPDFSSMASTAPASSSAAQASPLAAAAVPAVAAPPETRTVLVLPYLKQISGRKILWETPNLWRDAWKTPNNFTPSSRLTIVVPSGDSADVAAGSEDSVWVDDYSTLDALRNKYKASEVVLAVANKSGVYMQVDVYLYRDGALKRQKPINPYTTEQDDAIAFREAVPEVIGEIGALKQAPLTEQARADSRAVSVVAKISAEVNKPEPPPEKITLDTSIRFDSFPQWLEVQRRLASISPTLRIEIASLNKNAARFTISVETAGGLEGFKAALAAQKLELDPSVPAAGGAVSADAGMPLRPMYILKMN